MQDRNPCNSHQHTLDSWNPRKMVRNCITASHNAERRWWSCETTRNFTDVQVSPFNSFEQKAENYHLQLLYVLQNWNSKELSKNCSSADSWDNGSHCNIRNVSISRLCVSALSSRDDALERDRLSTNAAHTLYWMLYSLLSGWISCGNWTHWELINANH